MYSPYPPLLVPTGATYLGTQSLFYDVGPFYSPVEVLYEKFRVNRNPTYMAGTVDVLHFKRLVSQMLEYWRRRILWEQWTPRGLLVGVNNLWVPEIVKAQTVKGNYYQNNLGSLFGNGLSFDEVCTEALGVKADPLAYSEDSWVILRQTGIDQYVSAKFQPVSSLGSPPDSSSWVFNVVKKRIGSAVSVIGILDSYSWPSFPLKRPTYVYGVPFPRAPFGGITKQSPTAWLAHYSHTGPYSVLGTVLSKRNYFSFHGDSLIPMVFDNNIGP